MINKIGKKNWQLLIVLGLIIAVAPIMITIYEVIISDKNSVVFLEGYDSTVGILIITFYIILYLLMLSLCVFWLLKQVQILTTLKNEKVKTELLHLKAQINPHFFFNMLNNLYGLVGKDAKKAQDLILKLSDMMRYSIYEGEKESVELQVEVDYLKNYIDLHKMRYHKKIDITFKVDIQMKSCKVMPLLFIILLENAFKHGVEKLRENAFVRIHLSALNNEIYFEIENNFDKEIAATSTGIGLENLKRRLELVYPKKHSLSFESKEDLYRAKLKIHSK